MLRKEAVINLIDRVRNYNLNITWDDEDLIVSRVMELSKSNNRGVEQLLYSVLDERPDLQNVLMDYIYNEDDAYSLMGDVEFQIERLTNRDRAVIHENANKDSRRFNTQRELLAGVVSKALGFNQLPDDVSKAHYDGRVYFHDLDKSPYSAQPNCSLVDFDYLFTNGFELGGVKVLPPKSLKVATTLITQVLSDVSGCQFGGLSVHEIDRLLAPYAEMSYQKHLDFLGDLGLDEEVLTKKARELTLKEIEDSAQTLEYQINTMSSASAQVPFTTISLGLSDTKWSKEIQTAILNQRYKGLSDGSTAIFPKIIYFVDEGHNLRKGDPYYEVKQLAMRTSARRTYPDIISMKQMEEFKPYDNLEFMQQEGNPVKVKPITPMGCRSFLSRYFERDVETGKLQEVITGRQNLGVCSINLGRVGIESRSNQDYLFELLEESLDIAKEGLKFREERCMEAELDSSPLMYKYGGLGKPKSSVREYFGNKRATISIGYVGLHNCMVAYSGNINWQEDLTLVELSKQVLHYIQDFVDRKQDEFDAYLSVYGTPAESTATTMCLIDRRYYGNIEGVTSNGYYENSFHFASNISTDPYSKIEFESQYLNDTLGGNMIYVESSNLDVNIRAFESIWDYMYDNILYGGINNPIDSCFECGYEGEFNPTAKGYECPHCQNKDPEHMDVVRRVCGYLGSVERPVVSGKDAEIKNRVDHL